MKINLLYLKYFGFCMVKKIVYALKQGWPTLCGWKVLRPATFIKYLQKKIIFVPIEYSGMPAQRDICIINNVIATKVIILI